MPGTRPGAFERYLPASSFWSHVSFAVGSGLLHGAQLYRTSPPPHPAALLIAPFLGAQSCTGGAAADEHCAGHPSHPATPVPVTPCDAVALLRGLSPRERGNPNDVGGGGGVGGSIPARAGEPAASSTPDWLARAIVREVVTDPLHC